MFLIFKINLKRYKKNLILFIYKYFIKMRILLVFSFWFAIQDLESYFLSWKLQEFYNSWMIIWKKFDELTDEQKILIEWRKIDVFNYKTSFLNEYLEIRKSILKEINYIKSELDSLNEKLKLWIINQNTYKQEYDKIMLYKDNVKNYYTSIIDTKLLEYKNRVDDYFNKLEKIEKENLDYIQKIKNKKKDIDNLIQAYDDLNEKIKQYLNTYWIAFDKPDYILDQAEEIFLKNLSKIDSKIMNFFNNYEWSSKLFYDELTSYIQILKDWSIKRLREYIKWLLNINYSEVEKNKLDEIINNVKKIYTWWFNIINNDYFDNNKDIAYKYIFNITSSLNDYSKEFDFSKDPYEIRSKFIEKVNEFIRLQYNSLSKIVDKTLLDYRLKYEKYLEDLNKEIESVSFENIVEAEKKIEKLENNILTELQKQKIEKLKCELEIKKIDDRINKLWNIYFFLETRVENILNKLKEKKPDLNERIKKAIKKIDILIEDWVERKKEIILLRLKKVFIKFLCL